MHRADEDQIKEIQETVSKQVDIIVGLRCTSVELGGPEQEWIWRMWLSKAKMRRIRRSELHKDSREIMV